MAAGPPSAHHVAMKVTGHKTSSMWRRYAIVTPEATREALRLRREFAETREEKDNLRAIRRIEGSLTPAPPLSGLDPDRSQRQLTCSSLQI